MGLQNTQCIQKKSQALKRHANKCFIPPKNVQHQKNWNTPSRKQSDKCYHSTKQPKTNKRAFHSTDHRLPAIRMASRQPTSKANVQHKQKKHTINRWT